MPRGRANLVQTKLDLPPSVVAPIDRSTSIGKVSFTLEGKEIASLPVYPMTDVAQAGFFGRMYDSVRMKFQ